MPNPLINLSKVLGNLAERADLLPAMGGAVEDLAHPEVEEMEDRLINREERIFEFVLERPVTPLYRPVPPLHRAERHPFRYFLDGSARSYFLGTLLEHGRDSPVHFAQIGASLLRRADDGSVKIEGLWLKDLLFLARSRVSDALWAFLEGAVQAFPNIAGRPLILASITGDEGEEDYTKYLSPEVDLRSKAGGKVRLAMRRLEVEALSARLKTLGQEEWVIVDGSLMFGPLRVALEALPEPRVLGVGKSFRTDPVFSIGKGVKAEQIPLTRLLADLPEAHRTVAFGAKGGRVAFWYVRIRPQGAVDYPLMGVIKVELVNPAQGAVETGLIDFLSRCLVAERSVTPYGMERRWHACLYPVCLAEQAVKNAFFSREVVRASLRLPIPLRR